MPSSPDGASDALWGLPPETDGLGGPLTTAEQQHHAGGAVGDGADDEWAAERGAHGDVVGGSGSAEDDGDDSDHALR